MPLQNRVDPFGLIHAVPHRGLFLGNRGGCFHTSERLLKPIPWKSKQWIICELEFKNRRRVVMAPGLYTELFFLDEATALAAGHRPCYECRYSDAKRFRDALMRAGVFQNKPAASDISRMITGEIQDVLKGGTEREDIDIEAIPNGAMFALEGAPFLKWNDLAYPWHFGGYGTPTVLPRRVTRLTPRATCLAMLHGYQPTIHPTLQPAANR